MDLFNVSLNITKFFKAFCILFLHFEFVAAQCFLHDILSSIKSNYCLFIWCYFDARVFNLLLFSFLPTLFFIFLLRFDTSVQSLSHVLISLTPNSCLLRCKLLIRLKREKIACFSSLFFFLEFPTLYLLNLLLQSRLYNIFLLVQ